MPFTPSKSSATTEEHDLEETIESPFTPNTATGAEEASLETFDSEKLYLRRLSTVSRKFDTNNKGYLDETEQAMRRLDSQNHGYLDAHKVYDVMKSLQEAQSQNAELLDSLQKESRRNWGLRRGIFFLCFFTVLLTLANIGTSFAAARLAKDTQVSYTGDLTSTSTGERLGTTSKAVVIPMSGFPSNVRHSRHLAAVESFVCEAAAQGNNCTLQGQMNLRDARLLYQQFCPARAADGSCGGDGVSEVLMNCNGYISTIYGGHLLPAAGPKADAGYMNYPTTGKGYVAAAATYLFGQLLPCVQHFSLGMSCPIDATADDDKCYVFAAYQPDCMGKLVLCGGDATAN